jgi:5-methylcytosine-specific restriction endonuclease McrA
MKHSASNEDLIEAVLNSTSFRQVLKKLDLALWGSNYSVLQRRIDSLRLDTSHFKGQAHAKGKTFPKRRPTSDYLTNKVPIASFRLKQRLLQEKILQPVCNSCKQTTWLGHPIPLELEHIDGNPNNNSLDNLSLLCPNCHAFTETYRGKNQKRSKKLRSALGR